MGLHLLNENKGCLADEYTDLVWKCLFYVIVVFT